MKMSNPENAAEPLGYMQDNYMTGPYMQVADKLEYISMHMIMTGAGLIAAGVAVWFVAKYLRKL